jgi:hypothetical protein
METTDLNAAVMAGVTWRKSSRSGANGGQCVEVARSPLGIIAVRDSKDPNGAVLTFTSSEWGTFLGKIKGVGSMTCSDGSRHGRA